jgi:hypothetical protein
MFSKTLSDEGMTKIKVADLDEFYNFYVHHFSVAIIWYVKFLSEAFIS